MTSERQPTSIERASNIALLVAVLLAIALPSLVLFLNAAGVNAPDPKVPGPQLTKVASFSTHLENLAKERNKPAFKMLKKAMRSYAGEAFGFKRDIAKWSGIVHTEWLGISGTPRVVIGKDDYLFFSDPMTIIDDVRGTSPMPKEYARDLPRFYEFFNEELKKRGIPLLVVIAPNKHSILRDKLPDWVAPDDGGGSRKTALIDDLTNRGVDVLDLTKPVAELEALGMQTFQRTDTHWTDPAAFVSYQAIMDWVSQHHPHISATDPMHFGLRPIGNPGGDLASALGLQGRMLSYQPILEYRNPHDSEHGFYIRYDKVLHAQRQVAEGTYANRLPFEEMDPLLAEVLSHLAYAPQQTPPPDYIPVDLSKRPITPFPHRVIDPSAPPVKEGQEPQDLNRPQFTPKPLADGPPTNWIHKVVPKDEGFGAPPPKESIKQIHLVRQGDPNGPRLLMFRDSFAVRLIPFMTPHFSEAHFIWKMEPALQLVDSQDIKPDLVIIQWVERALVSQPDGMFPKNLDTLMQSQ